jgi:REase associating with pPIWI_RE
MKLNVSREWKGSARTLEAEVKLRIAELGLKVSPPTIRTIRLWRTRKILSKSPTRDFRFRQIIESLAASLLLTRGWTLTAIGELLPSLTDTMIEASIQSEATGAPVSWVGSGSPGEAALSDYQQRHQDDTAEEAVILLAQGILRQYDRILTSEIVRQDDGLPPELHSAMCRLGGLYISESREDRAACIHDLLDRARWPLDAPEWGLMALRKPGFRFRQAVLIDPVFRVPTLDCSVIASIPGTFGEDNLLEARFHIRLREAAERCGSKRDRAYTAIRSLLGRRSLITEPEFIAWLVENKLTPLQKSILEEFFQPVPDDWLIGGYGHRCGHCGTLMRPHPEKETYRDGRCPIRQCNGKRPPLVGERLDVVLGLHVAKPQILTYWTGPAIDELTIYEAAAKRGLAVELYPESDLCDVAIDGRAVGIDAKSYSSPISLALRLNRSIGGLINYRRRIVAIGEELIDVNPNYIATVRSCLDRRGDPSTLEIMSVSTVIKMLRSAKHAH